MKSRTDLVGILILCAAFWWFTQALSGSVSTQPDGRLRLSWNANSESDVAGYNVYRSTASGTGYSKLNSLLVSDTTYQDTDLQYGARYYYVVTAVDTASNESGYSSEASGVPLVKSLISQVEGYNLISFNVSPPNDSIRAVLGSLPEGFCTYVASYSNRQWDTWMEERPDFANDMKTMNPLQGYWLKMSTAVTLEVKGTPVPPDTAISLSEGPNLIAYLPAQSDSLHHALGALPNGSYTYFAGFVNQQWRTWASGRPDFANDLEVLRPGHGYWINMATPQVLRYPVDGYTGEGSAGKMIAYGEDPLLYTNSLSKYPLGFTVIATPSICDFWSDNTTLDNENVEIGDVITARDPDGVVCGLAVLGDERGYLLHVYGDDPTTAAVDEGPRDGDTISFFVNGYEAEQKAIWTERGSVQIVLAATRNATTGLPQAYALSQNFPNPFNPETQITYQLPQDSEIEITIYNLTGQKVKTLVNGIQKAGRHLVIWNGKDEKGTPVGSGVYFYRMRANEFSNVKRMLLLR